MKQKHSIKIKIGAIVLLAAVTAVAAKLYSDTFSSEEHQRAVQARWQLIQELPAPEKAETIRQTTDGGAHPYGIDVCKTVLLEITGMSSADGLGENKNKLADYYCKHLIDWHPGYTNQGKSGTSRTVSGPAGLAVIDVKQFWYGDVTNKEYQSPNAAYVLKKYPETEGIGHRFAEIRIVLCTRP